jgi:hypothetical protein
MILKNEGTETKLRAFFCQLIVGKRGTENLRASVSQGFGTVVMFYRYLISSFTISIPSSIWRRLIYAYATGSFPLYR